MNDNNNNGCVAMDTIGMTNMPDLAKLIVPGQLCVEVTHKYNDKNETQN